MHIINGRRRLQQRLTGLLVAFLNLSVSFDEIRLNFRFDDNIK